MCSDLIDVVADLAQDPAVTAPRQHAGLGEQATIGANSRLKDGGDASRDGIAGLYHRLGHILGVDQESIREQFAGNEFDLIARVGAANDPRIGFGRDMPRLMPGKPGKSGAGLVVGEIRFGEIDRLVHDRRVQHHEFPLHTFPGSTPWCLLTLLGVYQPGRLTLPHPGGRCGSIIVPGGGVKVA